MVPRQLDADETNAGDILTAVDAIGSIHVLCVNGCAA